VDIPQSLQIIAEIGIGLAGFSGLIVAFRKDAGPLTSVQKYRLQVLLALAFGAMFLALLPELLHYMGVPPDRLWTLAGLVLTCYSVVFVIWWITASYRLKASVPEIFDWFAFSRMAAGHIIAVLLQLAVIFSLLDDTSPGPYLAALMWYLLHAVQQFTRMLFVQPKKASATKHQDT
jgi:lipid-A-disaccharide synthase-like uncharacterized protein